MNDRINAMRERCEAAKQWATECDRTNAGCQIPQIVRVLSEDLPWAFDQIAERDLKIIDMDDSYKGTILLRDSMYAEKDAEIANLHAEIDRLTEALDTINNLAAAFQDEGPFDQQEAFRRVAKIYASSFWMPLPAAPTCSCGGTLIDWATGNNSVTLEKHLRCEKCGKLHPAAPKGE